MNLPQYAKYLGFQLITEVNIAKISYDHPNFDESYKKIKETIN